MRILVTGGTGHLGRAIVARLLEQGRLVRVLARHPANDASIDWLVGDLATGEGLERAVDGVDTLIHAATHSPIAQRGAFRVVDLFRSPTDVDVQGTAALLNAAARANVRHFIHISIVGLRYTGGLRYSQAKLAAEQVVRESPVPWSIVRATGFYWLLGRLLAGMSAKPLVPIPAAIRMQPVDSDDFAEYVVRAVADDLRCERRDFAGPQILTLGEIMREYCAAYGLHPRVLRIPLPRRLRAMIEAGQLAPDSIHGSRTWADWLRSQTATNQPLYQGLSQPPR
jgi:uncharacterized protein YbjT (DUF2867 family)